LAQRLLPQRGELGDQRLPVDDGPPVGQPVVRALRVSDAVRRSGGPVARGQPSRIPPCHTAAPCPARQAHDRTAKNGGRRMDAVLFWINIAGVAVFAATGALAASRKQMDIFGFMLAAAVTGVGGGTLRDLLLGIQPVFWVAAPLNIAV